MTVLTVTGTDPVRLCIGIERLQVIILKDQVFQNRKFLFLERLLKNRAASIVGVCRYDYNALLEEGIKNNVTYIYNGVPDMCSCPFEGEEETETLREIEDIKKLAKLLCLWSSPGKNIGVGSFPFSWGSSSHHPGIELQTLDSLLFEPPGKPYF